jgi:hypothetical protein
MASNAWALKHIERIGIQNTFPNLTIDDFKQDEPSSCLAMMWCQCHTGSGMCQYPLRDGFDAACIYHVGLPSII